MLELLEELEPGAKKVFQQKVHMNELTALSINGTRGRAVILTNHYLYVVTKGLFKSTCRRISPGELTKVEVSESTLAVTAAGSGSPVKLSFPKEKPRLLPSIAARIKKWQQEK